MIVVDTGPAMKLAASITRIPSRRRVMVRAPPVGRPAARGGDRDAPGKEYRDSLRGGRRGGGLGEGMCVVALGWTTTIVPLMRVVESTSPNVAIQNY
jgi:hypothetical protein